MLEFLEGRVVAAGPGHAVLQVGGLGFHLALSSRSAEGLEPGQELRILTHLVAGESGIALYGFLEPEERALFRRLLAVAGVGPALALALLSALTPAELVAAVQNGDHARLQAVRGVGRKTAERLVLELRDRIAELTAAAPTPAPQEDLVRVLAELGFPAREARERAAAACRRLGADADLQDLLRDALRDRG